MSWCELSQEGQYCTDHGGKICRKGKWVSQTNNTYKEEPWHPEYDKGGHATSQGNHPATNKKGLVGIKSLFIVILKIAQVIMSRVGIVLRTKHTLAKPKN